MSWLAKITIDYHLAYKRRFSDNYAWHRAAWQAFPGQDGKAREYLTRLDYRDKTKMFELLLLAHSQPIRPDWCPEFSWQLAKVHSEFLNYQFYRFDLKANPTRKIAKLDNAGKHTKNGKSIMKVLDPRLAQQGATAEPAAAFAESGGDLPF